MLSHPFPPGIRVLSVRAGREEPLVTISMTLPRGVADLLAATLGLAALVAGSDRLGAALAAICQEAAGEWSAQARELGHPLPRPLRGLESFAAAAESSGSLSPTDIRKSAVSARNGSSGNGGATRD